LGNRNLFFSWEAASNSGEDGSGNIVQNCSASTWQGSFWSKELRRHTGCQPCRLRANLNSHGSVIGSGHLERLAGEVAQDITEHIMQQHCGEYDSTHLQQQVTIFSHGRENNSPRSEERRVGKESRAR